MRRFGQHAAKRIAKKRSAPEFQSMARSRFAPYIPGFKSDSIHYRNINSIGDGMSALNRAPGIVLRLAELRFLRRMPANRRRIKST